MKRTVLIILNVLAFIGTIFWVYNSPSWESIVAVIIAFTALIYQFYDSGKNKKIIMKQKGGKKSINYQASGNMTINNKK